MATNSTAAGASTGEASSFSLDVRRNAEGLLTAYGGPIKKAGRGRPVKRFSQAFYTQFWDERVPWPEGYRRLPLDVGDTPYTEGGEVPHDTTAARAIAINQGNVASVAQSHAVAATGEATGTRIDQAPARSSQSFSIPPNDSIADLVEGLATSSRDLLPDEQEYSVEGGYLVVMPEAQQGTGPNDKPHEQMERVLPEKAFFRCQECRSYLSQKGRCLFCGNAVTAMMAVGRYMGLRTTQEERASGSDAALTLCQCGSLGCQVWSSLDMMQISICDMTWKGACPRCRVHQDDWRSRPTKIVYKPIGAP